ncbi:MAG: hypothetical protein IJ453_06350 [Oscillospiraceae bacterium]|nr:hypothetical protein [Oscillospiraceae bacterium]
MSRIFIDEATLSAIGDAIRSKEGSEALIPTTQMAQRITELPSDGTGNSVAENAMVLQMYSLNDLGQANSTLNLANVTSLFYFCCCTSTKQPQRLNTMVEELTVNCSQKIAQANNFLYFPKTMPDTTLRKLTLNADLSTAKSFSNHLANFIALEEIAGTPLDLSSATNVGYFMQQMTALREIRFQGIIGLSLDLSEAPVLSAASMESAISCLSGSASGLTLTLSAAAVNAAFETAEGAGDGSQSAAWAALIATKSNWTISLV